MPHNLQKQKHQGYIVKIELNLSMKNSNQDHQLPPTITTKADKLPMHMEIKKINLSLTQLKNNKLADEDVILPKMLKECSEVTKETIKIF